MCHHVQNRNRTTDEIWLRIRLLIVYQFDTLALTSSTVTPLFQFQISSQHFRSELQTSPICPGTLVPGTLVVGTALFSK